MRRYCCSCGLPDLQVVKVCEGYWRKECSACGSTGPFALHAPEVVAASSVPVSAQPKGEHT